MSVVHNPTRPVVMPAIRSDVSAASAVDLHHRFTPRAPVRLWNHIASRVGNAGQRLSAEELLASAVKRAGHADFGDAAFREPLARLVDALNAAPDYHPFGRFLVRNVLVELLRNRLEVEAAHRRNREVSRVPVREPVIVVALPRTGTTLLFNSLCADDRFRYLRGWETSRPAMAPRLWRTSVPLRRLSTRAGLAVQYYLTPALRDIHESGADGPEECTALLMLGFASQAFVVLGSIPGYLAWLDDHDYRASLLYHRRVLQLLGGGSPEVRWILKSPNHLPALDALLYTYPDARIVYLHRDPCRVVASCASLVEAYRGTFCHQIDRAALGREVLALARRARVRAAAARRRHAGRVIVDIDYDDLSADPLDVVQTIYRELDISLPARVLDRIGAAVAVSRRRPPPFHRYTLAQYGLSTADVRAAFT